MVKPKRLVLKPGGRRTVRVRVANVGAAPAERVKACLKGPRKVVRGLTCTKPRRLAAGAAKTLRFKVGLKPRAKRGRAYRVRVKVTAVGVPPLQAPFRLRLR